MKLTPSALALKDAIEKLYCTFEKYLLPDHVEGCPCCVSDKDNARLRSRPLRELSSDDLSQYSFKALTTWGTEADFKHFLPRLFDLVIDDNSITSEINCEVLFGKLTYTEWSRWPDSEREAVKEYFISLWRFLLEEAPQCFTIDELLCSIAQAADDLTPYLLVWQQMVDPYAVCHFLEFIEWNAPRLAKGLLTSAFWSERGQQRHQVVS